MQMIVLLSLILSFPAMSSPLKGHSLQIGCILENETGKQIPYPGSMCLFQDDGTLISAGNGSLRKFSRNREVIWEMNGNFHHQLNYSPDKKRILTIANEINDVNGKKRRQDVLMILDQDGKILSRISTEEILKLSRVGAMKSQQPAMSADYEISHFNSIYEIPSHKRERKIPWMRPGNILVNSLDIGIFVFSPDLKTFLHHMRLNGSQGHSVHDVQVTPAGDLLLFNNHANENKANKYSAIQKIDPQTGRIIFDFTARPRGMFYSEGGGGVQEFGDYLFFSHSLTGGFLYSKNSGEIIRTYPQNTGVNGNRWIQEIKMIDAAEFLKNSN